MWGKAPPQKKNQTGLSQSFPHSKQLPAKNIWFCLFLSTFQLPLSQRHPLSYSLFKASLPDISVLSCFFISHPKGKGTFCCRAERDEGILAQHSLHSFYSQYHWDLSQEVPGGVDDRVEWRVSPFSSETRIHVKLNLKLSLTNKALCLSHLKLSHLVWDIT